MRKLFWFTAGASAMYWALDRMGMVKDWEFSIGEGKLPKPEPRRDDLTEINGIGSVIEKQLNEAGIFSFSQLAEMSDAQAHHLEEELAFGGRMERDDWRGQARKKV